MKKKMTLLMMLASVTCLVLLGSGAFAQPFDKSFDYCPAESCLNYQTGSWSTFEASWLIGHWVSSPTDETASLGQISNLVVDRTNGRIALAILSDVPNLGSASVAVPFSSLRRIGPDSFALSFGGRSDFIPVGTENGVGSTNEDPYISYMSRAPAGSDLYAVPGKIDPNWVADIYRHYGQPPYWMEKGEKPLSDLRMMEVSAYMGAGVRSPGGEAMADVNDFVIDSNGHIAFVVLSDIPGRPDTLVAVPFDTLGKGDNAFALNTTKAKLSSAPKFDEYGDMNNPAFARNDYRHFGVRPYWTD